jgi:DNA-binding transcriptional LysR family regulator
MFDTSNDDEELWRRLDWNDVRTFLAVAECGSLNAAAKLLNMTQPTISRRMEDFEYRLRARLFDRSSRGIVLTEAGCAVRDLAQSMARLGGSIMRDVAGHDASHSGRVRMSSPDGIAGFLLAPRLPEFQIANPNLDLTIDCGPPTTGESEPDLSLETAETSPGGLVSTPIATLHYAAFASRSYLDLYGAPQTMAEVAAHRWVRFTGNHIQRGALNERASAAVTLAGSHFVSNSSAVTFQATRNGAGICSLPTYVVNIAPELVMLDLEPFMHPTLYLRHRPMIERHRRVKLVKEWLAEIFDPTEQPWFRQEFIHPDEFGRYAANASAAPGGGRRDNEQVAALSLAAGKSVSGRG